MIDIDKYLDHQKNYKHFDYRLTNKNLFNILNKDKSKISSFRFLPYIRKEFLLYKFNGKSVKKKKRIITLPSYSASLIYKIYADKLNFIYEKYVGNKSIDKVVTAYRKSTKNTKRSNIYSAKEVFDFISVQKSCYVIKGDFKSFFDNINHKKLKSTLKQVLNVNLLSNDWYSVFKSLTKYKYINYEDLENLTIKLKTKDKKAYFENRKQFSKFYKINSNYFYSNFKGIPQGTSISSILANVYMINFDDEMNNLANEYSGIFRRYSDDFIMILPSLNISQKNAKIIKKTIIKKSNKILSLNIESDKTDFFIFKNKRFFNSNNKLKELNYLGFRFTGTKIFLREKSIYKYVYKSNKGIKFLIRDFNDKKRAKLWSTKKIEYYKFKKPIFNKKNIVIRWNNLSNYYNNLRINQVKFVKNKLENKSKFNISKRNKENYLYGNFSKSNFLNYAKRAQNILEKENPSYTVMVLKQVRRRVDKNQRIYHRGISRNSEYI